MRMGILGPLLASAAVFLPIQAYAQSADDVVVMRRQISQSQRGGADQPVSAFLPVEGSDTSKPYWGVTGWKFAGDASCTDSAPASRGVGCVSNGVMVPDASCAPAGPRPKSSDLIGDYRACTYDWKVVSKGEWEAQCAETRRPVSVACMRSGTEAVEDFFCSSEKPLVEEGFNEKGCTFTWGVDPWSAWSDTCTPSATRARGVFCTRPVGIPTDTSNCDPAERPDVLQTQGVYTGCAFQWVEGPWASATPVACGAVSEQTRSLSCVDRDGKPAPIASCEIVPRPATEQTAPDYSSCTSNWSAGEWSDWSSTCSTTAFRTRTVKCVRSDGKDVDGDACIANDRPDNREISSIQTGCVDPNPVAGRWSTSPWRTPAGCEVTVTRERDVFCIGPDDKPTATSNCSGAAPAASEQVITYSSCSNDWFEGPFTWSSDCSDAAVGTRAVYCRRENGTIVEDSLCSAESRPSTTLTQKRYDGCAAAWSVGDWSPWSSTCSDKSSRSRSVACIRELPSGSTPSAADFCSGSERPGSSEITSNFSSCAPEWVVPEWGWNGVAGEMSSTCSASVQQNRSVYCHKRNAQGVFEVVPDSQCVDAGLGAKEQTSRSIGAVYTGCSYRWSPNDTTTGWGWNGVAGAWSSRCSSTAQQTRTVSCIRSSQSGGDQTTVAASYCGSNGPDTTRTAPNVSGCNDVLGDYGFESGVIYTTPTPKSYSVNAGASTISTNAYEGTYSARIPGYAAIYQAMSVQARTYNVSFVCKGNNRLNFGVNYPGGGGASNDVVCGPNWTLISLSYTFPQAGSTNISVWSRFGGADVFVDNLVMMPN